MERLPQFQGWTRDPTGDRPEIVFPKKARELQPLALEQIVGFQTQEGHQVEVTRQWAIDHNLITGAMCAIARCGIGEFLKSRE